MIKEFIHLDTVRNNALKLAVEIYRRFGIPDVIYVALRGGAVMGNVMSEFFQVLAGANRTVYYAAVVARSYRAASQPAEEVHVDGWTYSPERLSQEDKILFVDDIFDTGRTINHLVQLILNTGIQRADIAVAVHDYKTRDYAPCPHPVQPDFYCRRHVIHRPEEDFWIHYLSHELKSLSADEIAQHYTGGDEKLIEAFALLQSDGYKNDAP